MGAIDPSAPPVPEVVVDRPTLVGRLDAAGAKKLVLLVAPPGYGKSVLLAQWAVARPERRVAWITIEAADDDAPTLASHLRAVLAPIGAHHEGPSEGAVELSGRAMGEEFLAGLIGAIATLPPTTIVLDDFQRLTNPALVAEVAQIIDRSPPHIRFVVSARIDPALPLHRWRLDDELAQLRQDDLVFDADDAAELISRIAGRRLTGPHLDALLTRTEGWGAGLQLAALSLRPLADVDDFIDAFSGDDRHVSEYLSEHVLRHLQPSVREFLLETSVLDRLTGPLCDVVTGRSDGRPMLELLSDRSLFVTRLGGGGGWFRCHQLFRDLLRGHLGRDHPEKERILLRRAAAWYLDQDDIETAGDLMAEAGDDAEVIQLVRAHGRELYRTGRISAVVRWLDAIEPRNRDVGEVTLLAAAATMLAGNALRAEALLETFAARPDTTDGERVGADLILTWSVNHQPDPDRVLDAVDRVLRAVDTVPAPEIPDLLGLASPGIIGKVARRNGAAAAAFQGSLSTARAHLVAASTIDRTGPLLEIEGSGLEALVAAWGGSLRVAEEEGCRALAAAEQAGVRSHPGTGTARLALAHVARQREVLDQAADHLAAARTVLRRTNPSVLLAVHTAETADLALVEGDPERSLAILADQRSSATAASPPRVDEMLRAVEARALIGIGDRDRADRVLARSPASGVEIAVVALRLAVERGDLAGATEILARWPDDGELGPRLQRRLWRCIVDDAEGRDASLVRDRLAAVVQAAGEQGHIRLFLDSGHHAVRLLRTLYHSDPTPYLRRLVGAPPSLVLVRSRRVEGLVEQLSDRERDVLGLLPSRMDNTEIAAALGVSVNTLKTHLKHLYRKLDVTSRREAVEAAEALYLL